MPCLRRSLTHAISIVITLVVALLILPPVAAAGAPTILAAGQVQHHATVTWALPAGTATRSVEVSDSPTVASDGAFFTDHVKSSDSVSEAQTTYTSTGALDPGTYYVHVAGYVPGCDACPASEWSAIAPLIVPTAVQAVVEGSGQVTGPGGLSCAGAVCPLADVPAGPVALAAAPAAGFLVLGWSVEGIDAADTCGIALRTCTVTVAATLIAKVTVRFGPALPTIVRAGLKPYRCGHRVEVVNPQVQPRIDTAHPYLGVLAITLKSPSGKTITRKYKNLDGYFSSPDFYNLKPAKTYIATITYSGDDWRPAKSFTKSVKLGRC